tara:strand:- start:1526 stop:2218 length:693 start_codon:yes stop_codon:yes gene_type:complete
MNTKLVSDLIESIGDPILLSLILLLVVFFFAFKAEIASKLFNKNKPIKVRKHKMSDLKHHNVFTTLNRIKYEVANMKFYTHKEYDSTKTKMCEDFTTTKSDVCAKYMDEFLDYGLDIMPRDKLKKTILDLQTVMHEAYIVKIRKLWRSKDIEEEDIDYIVHLFEKFRYDVVNSFDHRVNAIFASANYQTNFSLVLAIFEMWAMGIDLLPRDMQTTFENLNGKFKNINYER